MAWAIEQDITTDPASTLVLICLANYADKFGRSAFPSVDTLCKESRLSERTIRQRLRELEELGLIKRGDQSVVSIYIKREDRRPICYDLQLDRGANVAPRNKTGCNPLPNGVQITSSRGASPAPNPISEIRMTTGKSATQKEWEDLRRRASIKGFRMPYGAETPEDFGKSLQNYESLKRSVRA